MSDTVALTTVNTIIGNKFFVPINAWDSLSDIAKSNIKALFIQKSNNPFKCPVYLMNRYCPDKIAMEASGRKGIAACFKCKDSEEKVTCMFKSSKYVSFDLGNKEALINVVNIFKSEGMRFEYDDRRSFPRLKGKRIWKINKDNVDMERAVEQERLANIWLKEKRGILVAPPRFGKSFLTAFVAAQAKTKVLILVHKIDLARQFYKDWLQFTTLTEDDIAINPSVNDMIDKYIVSICTYQQFIHDKGSRLNKVRKNFGLIIVDEIHKSCADVFNEVINSFYAKYRLGVTATPSRRDGKDFRLIHTFGPVLAEGGSEQLSCEYTYTDTGWHCKYKLNDDHSWNYFWNGLATDEDRNKLIAKYAIKDVLAGHKIMIPVKRHTHLENLKKAVSAMARKNGVNLKICLYHGELHKKVREELQKEIYAGKYDVVIGMDSIISLGFNAPPMSCIYLNVSSLRSDRPTIYQEYSRVRTKCKEKKVTPLIRIFRDFGHRAIEKSMEVIDAEMRSKEFTEIFEDGSIKKNERRKGRGNASF